MKPVYDLRRAAIRKAIRRVQARSSTSFRYLGVKWTLMWTGSGLNLQQESMFRHHFRVGQMGRSGNWNAVTVDSVDLACRKALTESVMTA